MALDGAHALARDRVAQIKPREWELPTPCEEWDVGRVACHLVQVMEAYDALLTDTYTSETQARIAAIEMTPDTAVPMLDEVSRRLRMSFGGEGVLTKAIPYPGLDPFYGSDLASFSVFEGCVHSWDLAKALGVDGTFSEELAQIGYDGVLPFMERVRAVGFTKPPTTDKPAAACAQARLLHLFGRVP
jgi:uncharacterized protein (TIGR03086 family)